jgi:hypothetical protein
MGKFTLNDAYISVNAVVLSDHGNQVDIVTQSEQVDFTAFGAANKEYGRGIGDGTITATFFQDFAAASVDATLWPLSQTDTPFEVEVRASSAAVSATNPSYTMQALLFEYHPIQGGIGEASTTPVTFQNASQDGIVRSTTP